MGFLEVWNLKEEFKRTQGSSIQKVGKAGQMMDSDIFGKENESSFFKQIYRPPTYRVKATL